MHDWNHDGKIDKKDQMMDYHIFEETNKKSGNSSYSSYSGKSNQGGGWSGLTITIGVCVGICVLALLLGVEIPGAVIELFLKIIAVVGFFSLINAIGRK